MNEPRRPGAGVAPLAILALVAGCGPRPEAAPPAPALAPAGAAPDLDAELARAAGLGRPVLVLVAESGRDPDDSARGQLAASAGGDAAGRVLAVVLDLAVSRNRATAARFHVQATPVLLGLSPRGVIVSRDEGPLAEGLVARRVGELAAEAPGLDAQLAELEGAVARDPADVGARLALADFLRGRQNLREAIPHLAAVARAEGADPAPRIRARVDLALAHLWVAEPEKGRREAKALIAEWGAKSPEARAGGNLALATQDARANRTARARQEFEEAIAAAPESDYARRAREGLARLPEGGK